MRPRRRTPRWSLVPRLRWPVRLTRAPTPAARRNSSSGMRRSHYQCEQQHEPEHAAEHNFQRAELCTDRLCGGHLHITAPITLQCGVTYTGPAANPATAILSSTMGLANTIFNLYSASCAQTTTIAYLKFMNSGGVYVQTSFSNLVITHNQFGNLPCCGEYVQPSTAGIYFDGGSDNSRSANNVTITWNQIGDSTSCTTPTNAMTDYDSPETIQGGCQGIGIVSSVNGMVIENNVIGPAGEGVHILCYGNNCEPNQNPPGPKTSNLTVMYNDFVGIHRIAWEEQPQVTQNVVMKYNTEHDATNPYFGNFALSLACCDTGATAPGIDVSDNVLIQNTPPHVRYGYGIEAWGLGATYNNNLIQGLGSPGGIAWCYGMANNGTIEDNTVQGPNYDPGPAQFGGTGYIGNESSVFRILRTGGSLDHRICPAM